MAFTETYIQPKLWDQFHFFDTVDTTLPFASGTRSVAPGVRFMLQEVRLHWSTAFASAESIVLRLSSVNGSEYNTLFFSHNMNNSTDIRYYYSQPLLFFSNDQLVLSLSNISHVNTLGIEVIGWAARGQND